MFIIDCLPFSKGLNKESLSYFGPKYLEPGSLIKVNLRNKSVDALVLESQNATGVKSQIKSADFQLKKIGETTSKPFLQKEFLEAIKTSSEYFAATSGNLLTHLIPSFILENTSLLSRIKPQKISEETNDDHYFRKNSELSILQAPDEERMDLYKSLIREEFARKKSVFLCLPKNEDIKQAKKKLERGIESFVYTFHNEMGPKELQEEYKKLSKNSHPILIIGTARWLFLPKNNLGTIIIDKENESGWKTLSRPFIDLRIFAEILANKKDVRLVIGDSFLRVETLYRYKQGEINEFESVKWRMPIEIKPSVIDLRESAKKINPTNQEKEFKTLSPELLAAIKENIQKSSNMFIFAARKGISSVTVCRDCGEQVKCNNCSAPMILYKTKTISIFKCHQCGETRDAAELCQKCGSWKLAAFGSGIDRVADEIKNNFPEIKLFELNKDTAGTNLKAQKITESFYENRGSILLGTEMAFSYLYKKVGSCAIASFDSLFSIPDFRIREKIFRLILQTKNLAKDHFLIQTRNPRDPTVEYAITGNLIEFYKKEIEDRLILNYPPFGVFVKITTRGTKNFVTKELDSLKDSLQDYSPIFFPSIHEKKGEPAALNAIIKMSKEKWPEENLIKILKSLPHHFEIKVDPDNLL
ncbi:MAG: primosomal protein N' [Candidatus Paceibacterota bacterium]|jgi:primosomal protein N'